MSAMLSTSAGRFVRHYLEMVIAMFVGMGVLWPVWLGVFWALGRPELSDRADLGAMTMALDMCVGMGAWMRYRGHAWTPVLEMSAAMVLPFAVLLVPYWMDAVGGDAFMSFGHSAMFVTMLLAMVWRLAEYTGHHDRTPAQV